MLTPGERHELDRVALCLYAQDPRLARRLTHPTRHPARMALMVAIAISALAGPGIVLIGFGAADRQWAPIVGGLVLVVLCFPAIARLTGPREHRRQR